MLGYLAKSEWNNTFQEEMFLKDIQSSANKLGWDESVMRNLALIVKKHVKHHDYDEMSLIKEFRDYYSTL